MTFALSLLLSAFKVANFWKVFLTVSSMLISLWGYALVFGWPFALGLIGLLFCHEIGHYIAAKQQRLDVGPPIFIPFLGAWINLKEQPRDAQVEAYVAYAGPFIGSISALAVYGAGLYYHMPLLYAIALAGFWINLFNLIPLHPLDGGRITAVLSPRIWFLGVPLLIGVWIYHPSPIILVITILAFPQLVMAYYYNPQDPANQAYYGMKTSVKIEYGILYILLVLALALMIEYITMQLNL